MLNIISNYIVGIHPFAPTELVLTFFTKVLLFATSDSIFYYGF